MTKTLCIVCSVEMRPEKNGVWVVETAGQPRKPYKVWSADLIRCPDCGIQVVTGFANRALGEHYEKSFQDLLDRVLDSQSEIPVFYDHENH